jgi:hypothetical protein
MSDLHIFRRDSNEIGNARSVYIDRCVLLIQHAFGRDLNTRQTFRAWIDQQFEKSNSVLVLLHDDPVYTVARFLGIPRADIDQSILRKAAKLARDHHW